MAEHEVTEAMLDAGCDVSIADGMKPGARWGRRDSVYRIIEAALAARTTPVADSDAGHVTVTTNQNGHCVAVTRTDDEGRILKVIWEGPEPPTHSAGAGADAEGEQ